MLPCCGAPAVLQADTDDAAPQAADAAADAEAAAAEAEAAATATTPVEAWRQGRLSLSLSGGGFLLPWFLGVCQTLLATGIISSSTTPMAGASAGALVVSAIKAGLTLQEQLDSFLSAADDCRQHGVRARLRRVLKAQLKRTMPDDAAARCSDGTCWIAVTQILPRPSSKLYGAWSSRRQLIQCLLASSHLPRLSDGSMTTSFKYKRVFDGGFSNLCPVPPVPGPLLHAAAAAAAPPADAQAQTPASVVLPRSDSTRGISTPLSLRARQQQPAAGSSIRSSALHQHQHSSSHLRLAVRGGRQHQHQHQQHSDTPVRSHAHALAASCQVVGAGAYAAAPGWFVIRVCVLPAAQLHELPRMFNAPSAEGVAITPDLGDPAHPWPHDLDATTRLALYPQPDAWLWELFERGARDAAAWAAAQGFPDEVLQRLRAGGAALDPSLRVVRPASAAAAAGQQEEEAAQASSEAQQQQREAAVAAAHEGAQEAVARRSGSGS